MWVCRRFIEAVSLLFCTCMAVHLSDLLFSACGSSAITSKGLLNMICVANCLELPRLASQLNSLPNKPEGKSTCAFAHKLWSNTKLCQCRCSCRLGSRRPGLAAQNLLSNTQGGAGPSTARALLVWAGVAAGDCCAHCWDQRWAKPRVGFPPPCQWVFIFVRLPFVYYRAPNLYPDSAPCPRWLKGMFRQGHHSAFVSVAAHNFLFDAQQKQMDGITASPIKLHTYLMSFQSAACFFIISTYFLLVLSSLLDIKDVFFHDTF